MVYTSALRTTHGEGDMSRKNARLAARAGGLVAALAPATTAAAEDGGACHPDGRDLQVTYQPVRHSDDATAVQARLTLANRSGACALGGSGWKLYFTFARQPLAATPGAAGDAARAQLAAQGLNHHARGAR